MVSIPGMQQLFDYAKSKAKLALIFEVVDDPEDTPESRGVLKPLNVCFFFAKGNIEPKPELFKSAKYLTCVPGLTKQTAREARQFAYPTLERDMFLYVLSEPTAGLEGQYKPRVYKIPVDTGRIYNIAVSLEPNFATQTVSGPVKRPKGFNT